LDDFPAQIVAQRQTNKIFGFTTNQANPALLLVVLPLFGGQRRRCIAGAHSMLLQWLAVFRK
jgi:hypothetical protein